MLSIGSKRINTNILLASLAGCADLSFRLIAREYGAKFCFYEMFDSNSLYFGPGVKTEDMRQTHAEDQPIAAQMLGADPEIMLKAAKILLALNENITFLDINAACPVKKVVKKKAGAYLLQEPESLYRIIDKLSANLSLPITVKLRTGYSVRNLENIITIAKKCEQSGAKALFVHGRTKEQQYSGEVDYASIKAIKDNVGIPVIASGNIFSPQKAKQVFSKTFCDGILVARGAFGNPWIFKQIEYFMDKGVLQPGPTFSEKISVLNKHIRLVMKYKMVPDRNKLGFARKVALWYSKKLGIARALRDEINRQQSFKGLFDLIDRLQVKGKELL